MQTRSLPSLSLLSFTFSHREGIGKTEEGTNILETEPQHGPLLQDDLGEGAGQEVLSLLVTQSRRRRGPCGFLSPILDLKKLLKLPQLWDLLGQGTRKAHLQGSQQLLSQHLGTLGDRVTAA